MYPNAAFQARVEAAIVQLEWAVARRRRVQTLLAEIAAIEALVLQWGGDTTPCDIGLGESTEPFRETAQRLRLDCATGDVTAGEVSLCPIRHVPIDMIAEVVARDVGAVSAMTQALVLDHAVLEATAQLVARYTNTPPPPDTSESGTPLAAKVPGPVRFDSFSVSESLAIPPPPD